MGRIASHFARTFHSQYGFRPIKLLEETCRIATCRRVRPHCDNVPMWFLQLPSLTDPRCPCHGLAKPVSANPTFAWLLSSHRDSCRGRSSPPNTDPCRFRLVCVLSSVIFSPFSHLTSRMGAVVVGPSTPLGGSAGSGLSLTLRPSPAESPMQPVQLLVTDEWNMQIDRLISLRIPQIPIARSKRYLPSGGLHASLHLHPTPWWLRL